MPAVPVAAPARTPPPPRPPRAPDPGPLSPGRAVAGAAVAVAGVCLLLGALLLVSGDPAPGQAQDRDAVSRAEVLPPPAEVVPPTPTPTPSPAVPSPPPPPPSPPPAARTDVVAVTVLNNSNRTGLADRAARRFVRGGWPVQLAGNFRGQIPVTTVYYDPGLEASARAFARDFDGIARVRPRFATLPARGVVVVLTREFPA